MIKKSFVNIHVFSQKKIIELNTEYLVAKVIIMTLARQCENRMNSYFCQSTHFAAPTTCNLSIVAGIFCRVADTRDFQRS